MAMNNQHWFKLDNQMEKELKKFKKENNFISMSESIRNIIITFLKNRKTKENKGCKCVSKV